MARVLRLLEQPVAVDEAAFADCDRRLQDGVQARIDEVERLHAAGRDEDARQALAGLDLLYGGLATPASLRMAEALYPVLRQPAQDGEPGS